jgi:hypothetical protein
MEGSDFVGPVGSRGAATPRFAVVINGLMPVLYVLVALVGPPYTAVVDRDSSWTSWGTTAFASPNTIRVFGL